MNEGAAGSGTSRRSPRLGHVAPLLVAVLALAHAGCRFERIWTGLQMTPNGVLQLAAEEPLCGCLTVVNAHRGDVRLRATQRGGLIGEATLGPDERGRFRFDWGGSQIGDFYEISVWTSDGQQLRVDTALEVEEHPRWVECEAAQCEPGDLQMNVVEREEP